VVRVRSRPANIVAEPWHAARGGVVTRVIE